jgi:[acyl-carrier-protein] S-malonyltransferase
MKLAFLFPGQGAQYVGMGKDLCDNFPEARKVFEEADSVLGFSLSRLCFEGPFEELTLTENCQPAVLTASAAALAVLKVRHPQIEPSAVAGLSLGEYSALVANGVLSFRDAVSLVRRRGQFMEEAARKHPGKMSCVLGLDADQMSAICVDTSCEIANLNCPGQVVISGSQAHLEAAAQAALQKGAKRVIPLDVSGPFHSSLMDEACLKLSEEIEKVKFSPAKCPVVCNVNAKEESDPAQIRINLIKQVNSATYWEASMRLLLSRGVAHFLEVGPGAVLRGLFKKIDPSVKVLNAGQSADLEAVSSAFSATA